RGRFGIAVAPVCGGRSRGRRRERRRIPRCPAGAGAAPDPLHPARIHREEGVLPGIGGAGTGPAQCRRARRTRRGVAEHASGSHRHRARRGPRVLLYKGPDAATEIEEAAPETAKRRLRMRIVARYELPDALGTRTIVEMARVA